MKSCRQILLIIALLALLILALPASAQDYSDEQLLEHFGTVENWTVADLDMAGLKEGDVVYDELMNWELAYTEDEKKETLAQETTVDLAASETETAAAEISAPEMEPKAILAVLEGGVTGSYVPCGDGKLQISIQLKNVIQLPLENNGEPMTAYIRSIQISNITGDPTAGSYELMDCKSENGESCEKITLNADGTIMVSGYVTVPQVYNGDSVNFTASLTYSKADGAAAEAPLVMDGAAVKTDVSMCAESDLEIVAAKGTFEMCGGKVSFAADIQVPENGVQFIVPSDVLIGVPDAREVTAYSAYDCRFTRFDENGNPASGGACEAGQRIDVFPNDKIRLEVFIDQMKNPISETNSENPLEINWRLGGVNGFLSGSLESKQGPAGLCAARIVPLAPLAPAAGSEDPALEEDPFWAITHNHAVAGVYQKCGKFAVIQLRLRNEGSKAGSITLPGYVSVNNGTPITYYWMSTVAAEGNRVTLEPGQTVSLLGRLYLTNVTSQTNADIPVIVTVAFPELNMVMGGQAISDKNTERCYTAQ